MREVYREIAAGCRAILLVMPTGSGKTVLASRVAFDAANRRGRRVLFMAHRTELLHQMSATIARFGVPHGMITAGVRTDPSNPVQVASVQSLDTGVAMPHLDENDLIIVDECHRADATKLIAQYPKVRRIGLTATPYRIDDGRIRPLAPEYRRMVIGATPRQLLEQGFIVPLRIIAPPPPMALSTELLQQDSMTVRERAMGSATIMGDVVQTWVKAGPAQTIAYCVSVNHAKNVAEAFRAVGVDAVALDGTTEAEKRRIVLDAFRAGRHQVLCNAMLFTEGLDVPSVSRILLLRPTESPIVYLQQVGRGVRPYPGKTHCEVFDHAGNVFLHGDPYDDRTMGLEVVPGLGRPVGVPEREIPMWRCPACFCVKRPRPAKECPFCHTVIKTKRTISIVAGELTEYDDAEMAVAKVQARQEADLRKLDQRVRARLMRALMSEGLSWRQARKPMLDLAEKWVAGGRKDIDLFIRETSHARQTKSR